MLVILLTVVSTAVYFFGFMLILDRASSEHVFMFSPAGPLSRFLRARAVEITGDDENGFFVHWTQPLIGTMWARDLDTIGKWQAIKKQPDYGTTYGRAVELAGRVKAGKKTISVSQCGLRYFMKKEDPVLYNIMRDRYGL